MNRLFCSGLRASLTIALLLYGQLLKADGSTIGKIYTPYVDQLGTEIELQLQDETGGVNFEGEKYRLGVGRPIMPMLFAELYVLAQRKSGGDAEVEGYEMELKWQITEQGEYSADYGVMLEVERETERNLWESSVKLLVSKEFGRYTGTLNGALTYETGEHLASEWETSLAAQWRYRYRPGFEPALEYFKGEDTNALGPVISGMFKPGIGKTWRWELGVIWGIDSDSVDRTVKGRLEYEF